MLGLCCWYGCLVLGLCCWYGSLVLGLCCWYVKSSQAKIVNIYFSTRSFYIFAKNMSKYCSRIIVVHVHATVFF